MMAKLYELTEELRNVERLMDDLDQSEGADELLINALMVIKGEHKDKCINVACFIKNLKGDMEAFKAEEARLASRRKVKENLIDHLTKYLKDNIEDGVKIEDTKAVISWRKSTQVVVECQPEQLPKGFQRKVVTISADKTAIKEAIEAGKQVKGASLQINQNIQVK